MHHKIQESWDRWDETELSHAMFLSTRSSMLQRDYKLIDSSGKDIIEEKIGVNCTKTTSKSSSHSDSDGTSIQSDNVVKAEGST